MGLKEQSDTYFQNLQSLQQQQQIQNISKTQGFVNSPSPNLNDLILDPYRKVELTTNKSRVSMTDDSRYLQNFFTKTTASFNVSINPLQVMQSQSNYRNRNFSSNTDNKENLSKSTVLNTSDMEQYRSFIVKTPPRNSSVRQSMANATSRDNTPDNAKKISDLQTSYTPFILNKSSNLSAQMQYLNANQPTSNLSSSKNIIIPNSNTNSVQQFLNLSATTQVGNSNLSPTLNLKSYKQKQKKNARSYRIQSSYTPIQGVNRDQIQNNTDGFIPINL